MFRKYISRPSTTLRYKQGSPQAIPTQVHPKNDDATLRPKMSKMSLSSMKLDPPTLTNEDLPSRSRGLHCAVWVCVRVGRRAARFEGCGFRSNCLESGGTERSVPVKRFIYSDAFRPLRSHQ